MVPIGSWAHSYGTNGPGSNGPMAWFQHGPDGPNEAMVPSVPYPICCIMLGLILIIRDHKQRWRCDTDNLSGNPTLKKLTTFWYSSMRSRQLNVFYHWLHMWPSGQKLDEVRLWLVFRIYADSLFNPAYEEYKQPKVHLKLGDFK